MRSRATAIPASSAGTSSSAVPTRVKTERLWSGSAWMSSNRACAASASPIRSIVARSRPSEKFGTDSSGSCTRVLYEPMKAYYDARAPEYDDWWRGTGSFEQRDRPGWEDEVEALVAVVEAPPPGGARPGSGGTGLLPRPPPRAGGAGRP